jgi:hypothetical protein
LARRVAEAQINLRQARRQFLSTRLKRPGCASSSPAPDRTSWFGRTKPISARKTKVTKAEVYPVHRRDGGARDCVFVGGKTKRLRICARRKQMRSHGGVTPEQTGWLTAREFFRAPSEEQ